MTKNSSGKILNYFMTPPGLNTRKDEFINIEMPIYLNFENLFNLFAKCKGDYMKIDAFQYLMKRFIFPKSNYVPVIFIVVALLILTTVSLSLANSDVESRLVKLKSLYEKGLITLNDYNTQKQKLLDQYVSFKKEVAPLEVTVRWEYEPTKNIIATHKKELIIGDKKIHIPKVMTCGRYARGDVKVYLLPGTHYMRITYFNKAGTPYNTTEIGKINIKANQSNDILYAIDSGINFFQTNRNEFIYVNGNQIKQWLH